MFRSPQQLLLQAVLTFVLLNQGLAQTFTIPDRSKDSLLQFIQLKYGLDQELINGFQFYDRFSHYRGNPFFPENSFKEGAASIRGKQYDHLHLKYNCYSQSLILKYVDSKNRYNLLVLNPAEIDSFWLGAYRFQKLSILDTEPLFFQVLESGTVVCYVHWKKSLISTSNDLQYLFEFSKPKGDFYVVYSGQINSVTGKKSFKEIFPESIHRVLNRYFRQHRFSIKKAGLMDIQKLILYTSEVLATLPEH